MWYYDLSIILSLGRCYIGQDLLRFFFPFISFFFPLFLSLVFFFLLSCFTLCFPFSTITSLSFNFYTLRISLSIFFYPLSFSCKIITPTLYIDFQDVVVKLLNVACNFFICSCVISSLFLVSPLSFHVISHFHLSFLLFSLPLLMLSFSSLLIPSKFLNLYFVSYIFLCLTMYTWLCISFFNHLNNLLLLLLYYHYCINITSNTKI